MRPPTDEGLVTPMRRTYWLDARPQDRAVHVFWLEGLRPVTNEPGHMRSFHGPYHSAREAEKAMRMLFPLSGWDRRNNCLEEG